MGRLRALKLGIMKGAPDYTPLCPLQHDPESIEQIVTRGKLGWVLRKIDSQAGGTVGLTILTANRKHDELCWPEYPKTYCDCGWCTERRKQNADHRD
jgi:hypothetical protein